MGLKDKILGNKKDKSNGSDPAESPYVTKQDLEGIMKDAMQRILPQVADIAVRASDDRQQQWLAKGGMPIGAPRNNEEAKDLRQLIYTPKSKRIREMTLFNAKECALQPWLWTLAESIKPGRPHGSLLSNFLLNKEQCNRSLDGFLLTQTVQMAGLDIQREGFTDSHMSS